MADTGDRNKRLAERRAASMKADWDPGYTPESAPGVDWQVAHSIDYAAYQLGQINRKLDKLIEAIQALAQKG